MHACLCWQVSSFFLIFSLSLPINCVELYRAYYCWSWSHRHFVLTWLQFSLCDHVQRIFVLGDSLDGAQSAFLSRSHEDLPCHENSVRCEGFFYPCRGIVMNEIVAWCHSKIRARRTPRRQKRAALGGLKGREWKRALSEAKEFNERFLSYLLAVNIADGRVLTFVCSWI